MCTYDFSELCRMLGKPPVFLNSLQRTLSLYIPKNGETYSTAYFNFMEGVVSLRTFSVSLDLIHETFEKEKKILELLHIDSMTQSPTWYLDACGKRPHSASTLLLTGHDVGFPIGQGVIQKNLNFKDKPAELFNPSEMGEDVERVVAQYIKLQNKIRDRVMHETPVLRNALAWSIPMISTP